MDKQAGSHCSLFVYWAVLRQFIATKVLTVALLLYPGLGLALGRLYTVVQCIILL